MPQATGYDATIVITTKNRKDSLRVALESAVKQKGSVEVLVVDDASTDGTSEMVRAEFPTVVVVRAEQSRGYILQRNRAAEMAGGKIIFSIDDDAAMTTDTVVQQVLAEFGHPRVAAVAIPFCNVNQSPVVNQMAPDRQQMWCCQQFIGTAHAIRRDVFLGLGGYRAHYIHQGEERDLMVRALAGGYVVKVGSSDRIDHFESPNRDMTRMDTFGRCNDILYCWHNTPTRYLLQAMVKKSVAGMAFGMRVGRPWNMLRGLVRGYRGIFKYWTYRAPVADGVWQLYQRLGEPAVYQDIEGLLPPLIAVDKLVGVKQAFGTSSS
jgi:glycosyltransferase involved in cell wall biosynthesis